MDEVDVRKSAVEQGLKQVSSSSRIDSSDQFNGQEKDMINGHLP